MRRPRILLLVLLSIVVSISLGTLVVRARPITNVVELIVAVGAPYITIAITLFCAAVVLVSRRRLIPVLAFYVALATAAAQVPWYYLADPPDVATSVDVRVLSSNLRLGRADATSFVALARKSADVITVSELTPAAVDRFTEAGLGQEFPHSALKPSGGAGGIGLWSRHPLSELPLGKSGEYTMSAARIQIPGVRLDPLVASVHVESPVASNRNTVSQWRIGMGAAKAAMSAFAVSAGPGAVIIAGDFNSTPDERQFRDLMTNGYRDAVQQTGSGFAPTFPSRSWHPPLLTIDHIITRNAAAQTVKTVYIPGSDHRALLATIKVPLDPATP